MSRRVPVLAARSAQVPAVDPRPAKPGDGAAKSRAAQPERWKNVAGYLAAAVLSLAVMILALRLWEADPSVPPAYGGDNLVNLMLIQTTLETGWYLDNDRLGAPGRLDMRDFPIPDVLHFGVVKLLGCFVHDPVVVLNLYALLPFPVTALSTYFVLRRFRLGRLTALVPSVLYACLPYHFFRMWGHLFLAAYYLLPPMLLVVVRVYMGRHPFLRDDPPPHPSPAAGEGQGGGTPRWCFLNWQSAGAVMLCVLTGLAGVYYAFFSCFFLLAAAVKAAFRDRSWTPILVSAILVLVVAAAFGAAVSPTLLSMAREGQNPEAAARSPGEADLYSLGIDELLLPIPGHRIAGLALLRENFLAAPRRTTGEAAFVSLGALGAVGFLWLIGRFLWRRRDRVERIDDCLGYLNLTAVLLATVGGFGACFNFLVTPMIRCYNRISIFIAFFALCSLFVVIQRLADRHVKGRWAVAAYAAGLGAVLWLATLDQTTEGGVPPYAAARAEYDSDADFGRRMEAVLPDGAMVYQMPHVPFPEAPQVQNLDDYELLRPYLHTHTLRWSYGAMKGRDACRWQAEVASLSPADALPLLACAGFGGIYLDRAGYADHGAAAEAELQKLIGVEPLVSLTERQTFFDMTAYVAGMRARCTAAEWQAKRDAALHPVLCKWDGSISKPEPTPDQETFQWCGRGAVLHLHNPRQRPLYVILRMEFSGWSKDSNRLVVSGDLYHKELSLTRDRQPLRAAVLVPPGDHALQFTCDGPAMPESADPRQLVFMLWNFSWHEEP